MSRSTPTQAQPQPLPARPALATLKEAAQHFAVHPGQLLRLVTLGLPAIDLAAIGRPGARRKNRLLRFSIPDVERWLAQRSAVGGRS
jgi:hypothetical protein